MVVQGQPEICPAYSTVGVKFHYKGLHDNLAIAHFHFTPNHVCSGPFPMKVLHFYAMLINKFNFQLLHLAVYEFCVELH